MSSFIALTDMAGNDEEPLMAGRTDGLGNVDEVGLWDGEVEEENEGDLRNPGVFVWLLTLSAGISGLLFGCIFPSSLSLLPFTPN